MRSDLSEHYCCVQKGMENHIRVIWTHKLFSNCPNLQIILRYLLCLMSIVNKHQVKNSFTQSFRQLKRLSESRKKTCGFPLKKISMTSSLENK
jgi:hypothetical protein